MQFIDQILLRFAVFTLRMRIADFYDELVEQLRMNIGLGQYLRSCLAQSKKKKETIASAYQLLLTRVERGAGLSEAARGILAPGSLILISAGERVARVADGVEAAAFAEKARKRMTAVFFKHLVGPLVLLVGLIGLMAVIGLSVIPQFLFLVKVTDLGSSFRFIHGTVEFFRKWGWPAGGGLIMLILLVVVSVPRWFGRVRGWLDYFPPWSLYRLYTSSSLLIALSGLVRNNVTMRESIALLKSTAGGYQRHHLGLIETRLLRGKTFSEAVDTRWLPKLIVDRLAHFEAAGQLEVTLRRIGFENLDRSIELLDRSVATAAGAVRLAVGATLAWVVFDLFTLGTLVQRTAATGRV
jgi:type II secretory pathway component PulF